MKYGRRVDKGLIRLSDIFFAYLYMTLTWYFYLPWKRSSCAMLGFGCDVRRGRNWFWFVIDAGRNLLRQIRWLGKVFQYVDERRRLCVIMTHCGQRNLMNHRRSILCGYWCVINSCRCVNLGPTVREKPWRDCLMPNTRSVPKMSKRGCNHFQTPPLSLMERDSGDNNPRKMFYSTNALCNRLGRGWQVFVFPVSFGEFS